jgi:hypothetical protein
LVIDEIIGGGDGLAYKARKGDRKTPSMKQKLGKALKKLLGIKEKVVDPNAPKPPPTREEMEMKEMDDYYTNYNWELPDQKPMQLPERGQKIVINDEIADESDAGDSTPGGTNHNTKNERKPNTLPPVAEGDKPEAAKSQPKVEDPKEADHKGDGNNERKEVKQGNEQTDGAAAIPESSKSAGGVLLPELEKNLSTLNLFQANSASGEKDKQSQANQVAPAIPAASIEGKSVKNLNQVNPPTNEEASGALPKRISGKVKLT